MSAEPRRVTHSEIWTQWESQVVNGVFPLRRLLGCSDHGAVFLTEYRAKNLADAAIKFVRADALQAKGQRVQWQAAATLSHPHLIRLFEVGQYQSAGQEFVFVVMEHADQTLAQILGQRPLNPEEVRELLLPALDALAFLHRPRLVHGRLKPSNFLAVGDQLKLSSDSVRPAGRAAKGMVRTSAYDPPELKDHEISTAGDIWSLGMTLVEAFTQRTTAWPDHLGETPALPASFPASFADTVRRCLSPNPADRPTAVELGALYSQPRLKLDPQPRAPEVPQPSPPELPRAVTPPQSVRKRHLSLPAIAAALLISLAVWVGFRFSGTSQAPVQPVVVSAPAPVAPSAVAKSDPVPVSPPPAPPATSTSVLHEVTPNVPQAVREKIQGRIHVTVRVLVDPSGNVTAALPDNPGPSKYFARLADHAAREWQFAEAENQRPRVWLLRFEFTRDGVAARSTEQ